MSIKLLCGHFNIQIRDSLTNLTYKELTHLSGKALKDCRRTEENGCTVIERYNFGPDWTQIGVL
jgi:hypothetical protein